MKWPLVLGTLLALSSASAATWAPVEYNDETAVFIDPASVRPQGAYLKAWTRYVFVSPQTAEGVYPAVRYMSMKTLALFDCSAERSGTIQTVLYEDVESLGKIVHTAAIADDKAAFRDPIPGTIGESVLRRVCQSKRAR